jgi:hypothetical protein
LIISMPAVTDTVDLLGRSPGGPPGPRGCAGAEALASGIAMLVGRLTKLYTLL